MIVKIDEKNDRELIGNKASSLQLMKQNGFNVPNGFILDKNVFVEIMKYNNAQEKIQKVLSNITSENSGKISIELTELVENLKIPENIEKEIKGNLLPNKKYAVRSSGIKEDLENNSFAGQYDTFLNIEEYDEILKAILNCYKSMYSIGILSYCIDNNVDFKDYAMAVIIQEMVDSEKSGIAFTINPLTGKDKEILIEVAEGLGENLVSGKIVPQKYIYNWYEKQFKYDELNNKLLEEIELEQLGNTLLEIQMFFGYPVDVEFAYKSGVLYILQARAITKIMYQEIKDQWSTADFKDGGVSATVCFQYMWSLYEYIWENTLKKFIVDSKILKQKELRKLGDMFFGRPYWNVSIVKKAMAKVLGYKEREFDSELGVKITYEGNGDTTKVTPKSIKDIILMAFAQKKILKQRDENAQKYKTNLLIKYENYKENIKDINKNYSLEEFEKIWYKLIKEDYFESESTYFWQIFINTIHQSLFKDGLLKYVSNSEYFNLIGGLDNISHLLPFYDMWELSRKILINEESKEFWMNSNIEEIEKVYVNNNCFKYNMNDLKQYVDNYGYHSDKELDVTYPCYCENIGPVIKNLKDLLILDDSYSPIKDKEKQKKEYETQLEKIQKQVSPKKYKKVLSKIEEMRKLLWWREEYRDVSTRFYYIIRMYTLALAKMYEEKGVIKSKDDIWYLKIENIFDFMDKKITIEELNNIIERNKKYYNSFRNFMSENEIGMVFDKDSVSKKMKKNDSNIFKGIGSNNGIVTGTARVIKSLDEIDRLQVGDILITKFTDTGWTRKFAILNGIVTEFGGILCHASIISREYGIPCIVSAEDITKKIKDGSTITINGETGEIIGS